MAKLALLVLALLLGCVIKPSWADSFELCRAGGCETTEWLPDITELSYSPFHKPIVVYRPTVKKKPQRIWIGNVQGSPLFWGQLYGFEENGELFNSLRSKNQTFGAKLQKNLVFCVVGQFHDLVLITRNNHQFKIQVKTSDYGWDSAFIHQTDSGKHGIKLRWRIWFSHFIHNPSPLRVHSDIGTLFGSLSSQQSGLGLFLEGSQGNQSCNAGGKGSDTSNPDRQNIRVENFAQVLFGWSVIGGLCVCWFSFCMWLTGEWRFAWIGRLYRRCLNYMERFTSHD
jgi:hypothetical protein